MRKFLNALVLISIINFTDGRFINAQAPAMGYSSIIPTLLTFSVYDGRFIITNTTSVAVTSEAMLAAVLLNDHLFNAAGFKLELNKNNNGNLIEFVLDSSNASLGKEVYSLLITQNKIRIGANAREGFFYALQTLLQLLPDEIVGGKIIPQKSFSVQCGSVLDAPKYGWRSFMLDSGRQFQTVDFIKKYLEYLAILKLNVFHWHLTEGQGWRIEIKKYPRLTDVGSRVAPGTEQQGFYTQSEIREIVEYARKLCITVVPEIDIPGHSEAALIAYPELTCSGKAPQSVMEFSSTLFCGGAESTYTFLQNVLEEVCDLFPSEYIHLGGDEAPKDSWNNCSVCQNKIKQEGLANSHELQLYFSSRLAEYLKTKGRKVILWGDVVEQPGQTLPDNVVINWWNYRKKKDIAYHSSLKLNYKIICGTNYFTYLNFPVTPWSNYKEDRTFDLRDAYESNPSNITEPSPLVLGMGSYLWTDWNVKMNMIDRRVFPRILVLAEQMWNRNEKIPFDKFYEKVRHFYSRLKLLGINFGPALREEMPPDYKWD